MQNNQILINVIAYNKNEKERNKTINLLSQIHSKPLDFPKAKKQLMRSKNTNEIVLANYAQFDLLTN